MECQKSWSVYEELFLERISFFKILPSQSDYSENTVDSAVELLPKYFSSKWICGYDSIMHHSNLISVTFWTMAVSKVETGE